MENCEIKQIFDENQKKKITRDILEALPEWFEVKESREDYIRNSPDKSFVCAYNDGRPTGFLYLRQTGKDTVEIAVMACLKNAIELASAKSFLKKQEKLPALKVSVLCRLRP